MFYRKKRGKKGVWHVYWREDGKQRSKAVSTDLQVVKKFEIALAVRLQAQKSGMVIDNVSFEDFCNEYIDNYSKLHKRPRTVKQDLVKINNFKKYCPEVRFVKQFNEDSLNDFKIRRKNDGIKEVTINRGLETFKNMIKYAYKRKYIDRDFSSDITKFKIQTAPRQFTLDAEQINLLLKSSRPPYKTAIILGLCTGLRRGEVCHLEWSDVDFEKNTLNITEKPHLNWAPKNNSSYRKVPIHPDLKQYLLKLYEEAKGKTNFVCFYPENNHPLKEMALSATIRKTRKRLGLPDELCFHALRHTFVSIMSEEGKPTYHISKIIGHSKTATTEQIYTHLKDTTYFESIEGIDFLAKQKVED
ncbi:MAG: site-specific integrase [bacterium]|nr:site-specific integrase [bacterium]